MVESLMIEQGTKRLKGRLILDRVTASFEGGKIYGITGPNGSGKTMLLRALAGLMFLDRGIVRSNGKEVGKELSFPKDLGLFLEKPGFIPEYTAFENLMYVASLQKKVGEERIRELLDFFDLREEKLPARKFSLGMKQKLGLATALLEYPKILMLDEPWNALDRNSVNRLNELLKKEREKGTMILIASHDDYLLAPLAERVYRIENAVLTEV